MTPPLLALDNIHASYATKDILRGVSFEVHEGEVTALLGGNGAGKSTTLKVIAGLLQPSKGRIWFHGKDITDTTPSERQRLGLGYLLQGGRVFPNLTVAENLSVCLAHAGYITSKPFQLGDVFSELTGKRSVRAGLLSGGQRQMLAIEMILAQSPRLMLLDEPSGALAESLGTGVLKKLVKMIEASENAVLVVEQNAIQTVETLFRTVVLRDGCVAQSSQGTNN